MAIEGFQFIHESTYGRKGKAAMTTKTGQKRKAKWSGREIVAEAIRELGNCPLCQTSCRLPELG